MRKTLFVAAVFSATVMLTATAVNAQTPGWTSRYWDGCKPSCSWKDKKQYIPNTICKECDRDNNPLPIKGGDENNASSCDGGPAYTCWDMIPFADPTNPNRAYGYAAAPTDQCGKCFEITFNGGFQHAADGKKTGYATHKALNGKILTVMASNMGGDVGAGQFDILIPGGGLGQFDAFGPQIGLPKNSPTLGKQFGGFLADCEETLRWDQGTLLQYQTCLRDKCNAVFSNPKHALLKEGCNFYADWFMAANNPTMTYREVECPQILIDRYTTGGNTPTPGNNGGNPTDSATTTTYMLTVNRNPSGGGTTNPASNQADISAGTSVNISATPETGYIFVSWTITGNGTLANAGNASTSVTVNGNVTVTANFTQQGGNPPACDNSLPEAQRLTLTVTIEPAGAGSVVKEPNGCYSTGQNVTITAVPNPGYTFSEWAGEGINNATASSMSVEMWWHRTVTARFDGGSAVRNVRASKKRAGVSIKSVSGGFSAFLPQGHGFTSYSVVDLQGREVRSGRLGGSDASLSVSGLKHSVVFLRLHGKGKTPLSLKVVTY